MNRRVRIAAAFVAMLTGVWGCGGGGDFRAEIGKSAPTFETFDLDGDAIALGDFRGELVIVNFWASWCTPCRKEFPILETFHRRDDVTVLGVVFNDTDANARKFMEERKASWPGLVDDGEIAKAYGVRKRPGIPVSFVVDADGVLRGKHIGEADADDLDALVDAAS